MSILCCLQYLRRIFLFFLPVSVLAAIPGQFKEAIFNLYVGDSLLLEFFDGEKTDLFSILFFLF